MTDVVLVDLDGTVCDCRPRHHLLKDLGRHSLACADDPPVPGVIALLRLLSARGLTIALCSGRYASAEQVTQEWLARHEVPYTMLVLRKDGDTTSNPDFKCRAVHELAERGLRVVLAIEDYHRTAAALEAIGVPTVLVHSYSGALSDTLAPDPLSVAP